nr:SCO1860 family LAETG-anchored protein [Streptomyces sp. Xyl84]
MNGHTFRMPARRLVTAAAATALAAGPVTLAGAGSAHATTGHGRAGASVLRTALDVSLLDKTVNLPLTLSLNEVQAPASARQTALSARLDGVEGGKPFSVLRADVATADATVSASGAEGIVDLAHARLHVPGLPLLSLIEVDQVTARATCRTGKAPTATSNVLGGVTVLGRKVTLTAGGTTDVRVPGVGEVRLDLSRHETTSRTAAATALELRVSVNPLKLNVAEVEGTLTLARATCESPAAPEESPRPATTPATDPKPQGASATEPVHPAPSAAKPTKAADAGLAETGGSSMTPYLAAGSAVLLAAGGATVALTRRRKG